ncbi:uncharacterized protein N7458_003846 [Penicillium daleae]|uniref:Uncharacterized protein n=1 Tax=Penicillium daleae TaxID=63821 RepID=A0AAD6CBD5_9EURO|nr:uncharacterized protein N7458_003846 [Penicillium daleae]KAJ5455582.1 hypothetical protein N7458_003846 [Penicillium daleae]
MNNCNPQISWLSLGAMGWYTNPPHPTNHRVIGASTRGAPPSAPWEQITRRQAGGAIPLKARPGSVAVVLRKIKPRASLV